MEIVGVIKSKHVDHIRLVTLDKDQVIDVFYPESKKFDVEELKERISVTLDCKVQSVDYYGLKLGKFWLSYIISPKINFKYKPKKEKGQGSSHWGDDMMKDKNV